jgi:RHS repeat-associated protein
VSFVSIIKRFHGFFFLVAVHLAFLTLAQGQVSITFQGRAMYSTGTPAAGAVVTMTTTVNGSSGTQTTVADGGGNYVFQSSRGLPPCYTSWSFQAVSSEIVDDEPLPPSGISSMSGCVGPGTFTISDLIIVRPHEITLGGIVTDVSGTPVQGLTVTMTRTKYNLTPNVVTTATTTTDGSGHFQFTTYSRCSVVEGFKASVGDFIFQGGRETSGCVVTSNDNLGFMINLGSQENAGKPSCGVGRPVNVTNGNVYLSQTDYQLPGVGEAIVIIRAYNSISQNIGLFGRGWTTAYDEHVVTNANNQLELTLPDGRLISFATPDFFGQIIKNQDGSYIVTFKDGHVHSFNSSGKLVSLVDRNGNQTTLTYGGNGNLSSITDPFGRVLFVTTNSNGRVLSISDSLGTIATYTYGSSNQLLTVTYPDNSLYQFSYVPFGTGYVLTTVTDALGNIIEQHDYDSQGRALTSEAHGGVERYTLSYVSSIETDVTDALGHVTKYFYRRIQARKVVSQIQGVCGCGGSQVQTWTYDSRLNATSKVDALGHAINYTYDSNGNRLTETDATGTITYTYNAFGQGLTRTDQLNGVTTNTYDSQGNLLTTEDALNNVTTFTYDSHGQPLTITDARAKLTTFTWDTSGRLTQRTDALNQATIFAYDIRARLTSIRNALNETTSYEYDARGRLKKTTFPDTNFVSYTYDLAGRRTKVTDARGNDTNYGYDSAYRLTSVTDALNHTTGYAYDLMSNVTSVTDALSRTTNYDYDDFNRLVKITYPPAIAGATRPFESVAYDVDGNVTSRTDTAGRVTVFGYDSANRLTSTTDAANQTTSFQYDALSRLTLLTDAIDQEYEFAYDALDRQTQITRGGVSMGYAYDAVGNRTQRTDYNGAVTNYAFDDLNRLTTITYPDTSTATYAYDELSRLSTATNMNGTVTLAYDNRSRTASVTDVFGQTVGYGYDGNGNRTSLTLGGSTYASYAYDTVNRLNMITDGASLAVNYAYDATNKVTSRTLPNGVTTAYDYDGLNRLTRLRHTTAITTLTDNQYSYDTANRISQMVDLSGTHAYSYDSVARLTSATYPGATSESYTYDGVGNRTASHLSASYNYQPFNKVTIAGGATYTYDDNGNLLTKVVGTDTTQYAWDFENRLTSVTLPNGTVINYKYDALGRRIQRTTSAGPDERYVYDGQNVVQDLNSSSSVVTSYLNGPGLDNHLRQTNSSTGVSYFLTDHLGSTSGFADGSGNLVEQITYDSFGNHIASSRTRYTYTGRERDADTGLMYYRARYYDPQVGRFISEDPSGLTGGLNLYAYAANDPIAFRDALGLCPQNTGLTPFTGKNLSKYDKQRDIVRDSLQNSDCRQFLADHGIDPEAALDAVNQQQAYNGPKSTISRLQAGTVDLSDPDFQSLQLNDPTRAAAILNGPVSGDFRSAGLRAETAFYPGGVFGATVAARSTVFFRNSGLTGGNILHEALHSLTGLNDALLAHQLGVQIPSSGVTDIITQTLIQHGCGVKRKR